MYFSSLMTAIVALPNLSLAGPGPKKRHEIRMTVDPSEKYQQIEGFGFSGAFQRAQLLLNVTQETQQELFDLIYSTKTGVGFSMVRNGVGSSNSSFNDWMITHQPVSPGSPDAEPEYVWDEYDSGQLALSMKAVEYGVKRFYANAWSSPGFMKNNSDDANGGLLCGVEGSFEEGSHCEGDWRQAYADYFVKYIRLYASHGVNVSQIGFLNEPDLTTSYASMRSNAQQTADFLPILYETLERGGLGHVGIACCEHTGWTETADNLAGLQELGAEKYLSHITGHEYTANISFTLDTKKSVWQTEYCDLNDDWNPDWDGINRGDGWRWAFILHKALTIGNVNGYFWWLIVQDRATNNDNNEKLIKVQDGSYEISKRTWSFAHFSRFIRPEAYRIAVSDNLLHSSAYLNEDGSYVVVVLNPTYKEHSVSVDLGKCSGVKKVKAYLTDQNNDVEEVEVKWRRGVATARITSRGLLTFKAS